MAVSSPRLTRRRRVSTWTPSVRAASESLTSPPPARFRPPFARTESRWADISDTSYIYRGIPSLRPGRTWRPGRSVDLKKGGWMSRKGQGVTRVNRNRCEVHFNDELYGALAEFASRNDLPLTLSVRLLVERALAAAVGRTPGAMEGSLGQHLKTLGSSALD